METQFSNSNRRGDWYNSTGNWNKHYSAQPFCLPNKQIVFAWWNLRKHEKPISVVVCKSFILVISITAKSNVDYWFIETS